MKNRSADSKAWASFRIRGIQTTLKMLIDNKELSRPVRDYLSRAILFIDDAVDKLNEERKANENNRSL